MEINIQKIMEELQKPFNPDEIEWKVQNKKCGLVAPYVTNRAIQERLDNLFSPFGWENKLLQIDGGQICGISVWDDNKKIWITKWDGADDSRYLKNKVTEEIKVKGTISESMKRSAVQWGIGRYLYKFPKVFITLDSNGDIPKSLDMNKYIPDWAMPDFEERKQRKELLNELKNKLYEKLETEKVINMWLVKISQDKNFKLSKAKIPMLFKIKDRLDVLNNIPDWAKQIIEDEKKEVRNELNKQVYGKLKDNEVIKTWVKQMLKINVEEEVSTKELDLKTLSYLLKEAKKLKPTNDYKKPA